MTNPDNLTAAVARIETPPIELYQGVVTAFDGSDGSNTITLAGGRTLTDVPLIGSSSIVVNQAVSLIRWRGRYFVLGLLTTPNVNTAGLIAQGTYTPTITVAGGGSVTLITQRGIWWRVGHQVSAAVEISANSFSGTNWRLSLPFLADTSFHTAGFSSSTSDTIGSYWSRSSGDASESTAGAVILSSSSLINFIPHGSNTLIGAANFTTSARIKAQVHYVADPTEFVV